MTSDRKSEANRQNAQKSTGPKTPEGKAAVRHNALRHGLLAKDLLLPDEDEGAFNELSERLRDELQPAGQLENLLVERIIACAWRLRRLGRVEAGLFSWSHLEELAERAEREAKSYEVRANPIRYPDPDDTIIDEWMEEASTIVEITDKKKHEEALERARRLRSAQQEGSLALGRAFARDAEGANALSKLSRYEVTLERSLHRALHDLERLQRARSAPESVPPPLAVDVDVSGMPEGDR